MHTNELTHITMPRHHLANAISNPVPRDIDLTRKPVQTGLSREALRKIVVDLIG